MLGTYALVGRLLRRLLRPGAEGPHARHPGLRRAPTRDFDVLLTPTTPSVAFPFGVEGRRPARDVPVRPVQHPVQPRRPSGGQRALRARATTGSRSACRSSPRRSARRSCCGSPPASRPRRRARGRAGGPVDAVSVELRDRGRPRGALRARDGDEALLRVPRTPSATSRTPTSARSASGFPARSRCSTGAPSSSRMRIGTALNCTSRSRSIFHRKNYFYPDMPKDYQISQYDEPINVDGWLELPDGSRVGIERAHMEEDTGKTTHVGGGGRIHEAGLLARRLQPRRRAARRDRLARRTSARRPGPRLRRPSCARSSSRREPRTAAWRRGRCASTPTSRFGRVGTTELGTRCEVKNLNSLRSLERAIDYEVGAPDRAPRGRRARRAGDPPLGRGRRAARTSLRSKEEANDYRYFPEPDLVPLVPDDAAPGGRGRGRRADAGRAPPQLVELVAGDSDGATRRTPRPTRSSPSSTSASTTSCRRSGRRRRPAARPRTGRQRGGREPGGGEAARPGRVRGACSRWSRRAGSRRPSPRRCWPSSSNAAETRRRSPLGSATSRWTTRRSSRSSTR